jgi:hypothetical protein
MANTLSKNGKAHVLEISNRASIQKAELENLSGITGRLDNHESGLNANAHGISNIAGLQTALNGKESVFSKNTAFNKNFGTTAGTVTQGNDSRLSDSRTPTSHTHSITDVTGLQSALDGKQNLISGVTGSLTYVKTVNFAGQTVTTGTININNGIITSIS